MKLPTKQRRRESDRQEVSMSEANGKGWDYHTITAILKRELVYVVGRYGERDRNNSRGYEIFLKVRHYEAEIEST